MISSNKIKLFVILNVMLFLIVGCNIGKKESVANKFSIYLVKDLSAAEAMSKKLNDLPLETIPVLNDKEMKSYNWTNHEFMMKEGISLEERLEGKISSNGKPFVVVAGNERIYLGSFWATYSSQSYRVDIPIISSLWLKRSGIDTYKINYGKNPILESILKYSRHSKD